jgi:U6 snRNA-associated Sm-like protein LSm3
MNHGLHKDSQGRHPIDVSGIVSVVASLAASLVWAAGCGPPVPGAVHTTEIEQHIVAGAVADDAGVYVVTGGLVEDTGRLHAFDEHFNLVLSEVEEEQRVLERDAETGEVVVHVRRRALEMLFLRGDMVILVSPPLRT